MKRRRKRIRGSRPIPGNAVLLLEDGPNSFESMLEAVHAAEHQILLEMYWFASDHIGQKFADALLDAVKRNVEVAVLYDSLGSIDSDPKLFDRLRAGGVQVLQFHPLMPWSQHFHWELMWRRDHRKILVVDGKVGFTGGVNIADQWGSDAPDGGFRDESVRIEGPAATELVKLFCQTWQETRGEPLQKVLLEAPAIAGRVPVAVLGQNSFRDHLAIAKEYRRRIGHAKSCVYISNAYFVPTRKLRNALCSAAQRGVDVRVLLPGRSDVPIVRLASQATWKPLLQAGVRLFELERRVLHSKTAVVDGEWATIGTFNLDHLSARSNKEVNVAIFDEETAAALSTRFMRDLDTSREVTLARFQARSIPERVVSRCLFTLRSFL